MLAVARTAAAREGVAIEWREGRAEKLPFPDGSVDLVLCQFALMFFTDRLPLSPRCSASSLLAAGSS